jgi:hypothetical protein
MNATRSTACMMLLLTCFLTWSIAQADEIPCEGISCRGYNLEPEQVDEEKVDDEEKVEEKCEGVACRYNQAPKEVDVSGVDDNLFRHDLCVTDVSGLFGSNQGDSQSVDYFYQVETEPTMTTADMNGLLGKIESSITRTILPELFSDQCAPTSMSRKRQQREPIRRLEVMGVSSIPPDKVLDGGTFVWKLNGLSFLGSKACANASFVTLFMTVPCRGEVTIEGNGCYVIDGTMTLYSDSEIDESQLDTIRNLIRTATENGDYDNVDPNIVQVSYREDLGNDENEIDGSSTPVEDDTLPIWSVVFIGIGSLLILLGIFFLVGKRHKRNQQERGLTGSFPSAEEYTEINIVTNSRSQQSGEFPTIAQQSAYNIGAVA